MVWSNACGTDAVVAEGTALSLGHQPNELWCTDYKGDSLLGNQKYCYPLTVKAAEQFLSDLPRSPLRLILPQRQGSRLDLHQQLIVEAVTPPRAVGDPLVSG